MPTLTFKTSSVVRGGDADADDIGVDDVATSDVVLVSTLADNAAHSHRHLMLLMFPPVVSDDNVRSSNISHHSIVASTFVWGTHDPKRQSTERTRTF
jgi:hypothetical protein